VNFQCAFEVWSVNDCLICGWETESEIGAVKDLHRLVNLELSLALERSLTGHIEELDCVSGIDLDRVTIAVFFIQSFVNTTVIVVEQASVLHQLNGALS